MALMRDINEKVYKIIGSCLEVHRVLGPGYSPDYYIKALEIEFPAKGLSFEKRKSVSIVYKDSLVGTVEIDFLVADEVLVDVRSQDNLDDVEVQRLLRMLQLTGKPIGIVVNFGTAKIQYKRVLPGSHHVREIRKDIYRMGAYREIGKTREGNPVI
jgi:GxxExxY protein